MQASENYPHPIRRPSRSGSTESASKLPIFRLLLLAFSTLIISTFATPEARAQALVEVSCFDNEGDCEEILNPNPVLIAVGESVQWFIDLSCADRPCSGDCEISIPEGPGFPGFNDIISAPGFSSPTPPFNQEGVFYYQLECSPAAIGTIIIGNPFMQLFIQGSCPGSVTLEAKHATVGGRVAFTYGFSAGSTALPGCAGISLDINNAKLAGFGTANSAGVAQLIGNAPAGVCGQLHIQAAELATCRKSNVANL